ncbi:hypothetical protein AQUCO_01600126v1 [Aquilegia coerulea]|uniref:Cytochrome P450 n=1 Tax=Aquilegia coerulea TaxID=218851 RepID=A0A2G5DQZ8_AQUCA|nr:hypothetical protein AQUCO_01600126v1 [Aquilegia coerulea]
METKIESLWVLALITKCYNFSSENLISSFFLLLSVWFAMVLIYWAYPGGQAWGKFYWIRKPDTKFIPGPRGLPLFGSMNMMASRVAHQRLASEADRLGAKRLMALSLGETRVIVTSNPNVAKEILNNSVFVDRPAKESAYMLMFNRSIGFANYGVYWRTLRKIAATHLFSPKQINSFESQRLEIANQMISNFGNEGNVRVRDTLIRASLNNMMCSVFGREYGLGSFSKESEEVSELVQEGYELLGLLNWSDHLPWLARFDPQLIRFRCSKIVSRVNRFVRRIIAEHRAQMTEGKNQDFVDVLLSVEGPDKLSDTDMAAVLWEMIFRGTDTVAILIEWILARMVLHPEIQTKVQKELDEIVGTSRGVRESDIPAMTYLPAVIKEVLRLHPPGPLLSWARLAITDTIIDGKQVPAGTTGMVNMWAIMRDPEVWCNPLEFEPERFLTKDAEVEFSVLGSDLRLAPFGSGRRSCPGKALGMTTVSFWVASLLHEFEWKSVKESPVDLSEALKLSCEMARPLVVKLQSRRR